jgi:hypothetical protein
MALQSTLGGLWVDGLLPAGFTLDGDGSLDAHAQFELGDGVALHEDLLFDIEDGTPTEEPQQLQPILDLARWLFRTGPGTWGTSAGNPLFPTNALGSTPGHNANGTTLQVPADNQYVLATYFGVKSAPTSPTGVAGRTGDRVIAVAGQSVFSALSEAQRAGNRALAQLDTRGLPNDLVPICTVIIQYNSGFTNAGKARIVSTDTGDAFFDHRKISRRTGAGSGGGGGNGAELVSFSVNQAVHGFSVLDIVGVDGAGNYFKAQANSPTTLGLFVVSEVADANNFTVVHTGRFTVAAHGLTVGGFYALSATVAGGLTAAPPQPPNFIQIFIAVLDSDTLVALPWSVPQLTLREGHLVGFHIRNNAVSPNTVIDIGSGEAISDTESYAFKTSSVLQPDISVSGVNGLDTGVVAANTWYAVLVIGDITGVNPVAGLFTLTPGAPTMPAGYNETRRVGWVRTDGAGNILPFHMVESEGRARWTYWDAQVLIETGGSASAFTNTTTPASDRVPPTAQRQQLMLQSTKQGGGNPASRSEVQPSGWPGVQIWHVASGTTAASDPTTSGIFEIPVGTGRILQYRVQPAAAALADVAVLGWEDTL